MIFQEEAFKDIQLDVAPLLNDHHKEISKHDFDLDPDFEMYLKISEIGLYKVYTVRDDEGELVGYSGFFLSPMKHFKTHMAATCDVLYIIPALRGNGIGKHFLTFIDSKLSEIASVIFHFVPAKNDWSIILKDKGYTLHDYMYSRRV